MTAVSDLVLERHVDPATRQEMIRTGLKAAFVAAEHDPPGDLSARVSAFTGAGDLSAYLVQTWPQISKLANDRIVADDESPGASNLSSLREAILRGLLQPLSGEAEFLPATEAKVQDQLSANRYVGIGISLGIDKSNSFPEMVGVFPAGPAAKAGALRGDLIVEIDGISSKSIPLHQIVSRLRGEEGSALTVVVQRPDGSNRRTLDMVRGVVPRQTVRGYQQTGADQWDCRVEPDGSIAYLKIDEIGASALDELRHYERRLADEGIRALILDFRGESAGDLRYAVTLADGLLPGGVIGRVKTRQRVTTYYADADCLFRDWPLAVLVDEQTNGTYAWVAAALHDRRGAVLVGVRAIDRQFVTSFVELPGAEGALRLATAELQPGNDSRRNISGGYLELQGDYEFHHRGEMSLVGEAEPLTTNEIDEGQPSRTGEQAQPTDPVLTKAIEVLRSKHSTRGQ
jgi:carboxyl-terminal processing protease